MFSTQLVARKLAVFFNGAFILSLFILAAEIAQAQRPYGIDVSSDQSTITWSSVQSAGITFAWAKATEGTFYIDADFKANEVNGKAAGVYMGAYHFAHPEVDSPETEAEYFWNVASNYVKNDGKTFMPMLDYETFKGPFIGASSYADWANQWCADVQALAAASGVSVTPVIYISACDTTELSSVDAWTLPWIAAYNGYSSSTGNPWEGDGCTEDEIWGSGVWDLWQFSDDASISGISGAVDEDVYNGTSSQLVSTFLAGVISTTAFPTNVTVSAGNPATFNVSAAASTGTLAYQWRWNQKNISGATTNTYTITNAQWGNAGAYSVVITNNAGSSIINTAFLSVIGPLTNSPGSILAPTNMVNWWAAGGNGFDIYGTNNFTPAGHMYYTNGEVQTAFHFDGQTTCLPVSGGTEISPNWTASMWIYHTRSRCDAASVLGDQTYAIKVEQYSNTDEVGISESSAGDYVFSPAYTIPFNVWTYLAFVANSTNVILYTNGVQEGTVTASNFKLPRSYIGADNFSTISGVFADFMAGAVDELQIFTNALAASQIKAIYNAGSAGLVRAPQFTSVTNLNSGQVQLNVIGQTGKTITLLSSTNLFNWSTLATVSNSTGATNYTGSTTPSPQTFYQATQKY